MSIASAPDARFPADFVWGAATAAYQIEGATTEDGRGASIWDTFSHTPGRTLGGDTGDRAVEHYHRMPEDVALIKRLGLTGYRFSVSWPRIQPTGRGQALASGLDFYSRLVDELLMSGIEPYITLYHWDLPQALEDAGGWPERDTALRFADYAVAVHDALGDRVRSWTTLNEPWCSAFLGYANGHHAPGRTDPLASIAATRTLLVGHGLATQALHAAGAEQVGITLNLYAVSPASDDPADVDAARRMDGLSNRIFLDPVLKGAWPDDVVKDLDAIGAADPLTGPDSDEDLAIASTPIDFMGVNYYSRHVVAGDGEAGRSMAYPGSEHVRFVEDELPTTAMGWRIDATGLTEVLEEVARMAPELPLYVTENGAAFADDQVVDGRVADLDRVSYLNGHVRACHEAIRRGVPLRGYFAWSLMDNFEWAFGYDRRFGLVHVDYDTMRRTPKASAEWYSEVIRLGGPPVIASGIASGTAERNGTGDETGGILTP